MVNPLEVKAIVNPQELATRYLGSPLKRSGDKYWYKSPFRTEERTASFMVDTRGFYDFGTSKQYDIFEFVKAWHKCDFRQAMEILCSLYGIKENEYENARIRQLLKQQQEENKRYIKKVEDWFLDFSLLVEREWEENHESVKALSGRIDLDGYALVLNRETYLDGLRETLMDIETFKDKEKLRFRAMKGEVPTWLMKNLKNYTTNSEITNTKQHQKTEY